MLRAFSNPTNNPNNKIKVYKPKSTVIKPNRRQFLKTQSLNAGKHTLTINPKTY